MKTLTATVAALVAVATLSAAPAMAESTVLEQRAKLDRILQQQDAKTYRAPSAATYDARSYGSKSTNRVISTRMLTDAEKFKQRLLRVQPIAAGGGR